MKLRLLTSVLALASVAAPAVHAADKPAETAPAAVKRHPLRGVITAVDAEKSALRVKHEAIPGVMGAMTMQFKVDAAALKTAKVGATITGLMSRQPDHWLLEDVKIVTGK
jgi:Cu/Ag efflux protein CusF